MSANLIERTTRAVEFAMVPMLADVPILFADLPPHEIASFAYSYFRIADAVIRETWRMCVERRTSLDEAWRVFSEAATQALIRDQVARMCLESLRSPGADIDQQKRWSVNEAGRLVDHAWHAPHTTFSREHRLHWEQDPESNYKGIKAEAELRKLRDRLRREKLPWSREMCKTMGVTPRRAVMTKG